MIKLKDLLEEVYVEKPSGVDDEDLMQRGFKLSNQTIDPETGSVASDVTYLPEFENVRRQVLKMRKEFQPFKFSSNADIAKISKEINNHLTKVSNLVFALDKTIELERKSR
jgi:hypothetical protein